MITRRAVQGGGRRSLSGDSAQGCHPILIWIKSISFAMGFHLHLRVSVGVSALSRMMMSTLKNLTIVAVLLVGGTSLAMAQNGLPTGGQSPVAGGANGGSRGGGWYGRAPVYGYRYGYPAYGYGYGPYRPLYGYYRPYWR
jgi:hypothetical protein